MGVSPDYVLYDMSYENLILYSAATPQYDDKEEPEWDAAKDANNPDNFGNIENEDFVR